MGALPVDAPFNWFVNGQIDLPMMTQQDYRPGTELDAAAGVYYEGWTFSNGSKLSPLLQVIGSFRGRDSGANSNAPDSGYSRLLISPGLEYDVNNIELYGDVEIPVYQNFNGNQLISPVQLKFIVGYKF